MSEFLAVKANTERFWIETSGDKIAEVLASGSDNEYFRISRNEGGKVVIVPVVALPAQAVTIDRVVIEAGGEAVGSADTLPV